MNDLGKEYYYYSPPDVIFVIKNFPPTAKNPTRLSDTNIDLKNLAKLRKTYLEIAFLGRGRILHNFNFRDVHRESIRAPSIIGITGEADTHCAAGLPTGDVISNEFLVDDSSCLIHNCRVGAGVEGIANILTVKCRWNIEEVSVGLWKRFCQPYLVAVEDCIAEEGSDSQPFRNSGTLIRV